MPAPEVNNLRQYAVLWAAKGHGDYGQHTVSPPVEIRCRWEQARVSPKDPKTDLVAYSDTVHVQDDVPVHSLIWLGRLSDLVGTASPGDVHVVTDVTIMPDIKNRYVKRTLTVTRRGDTLLPIG